MIKNIIKFLLLIILVLILTLIYRAYVVIQPCRHKIEKINPVDRIKLDDSMLIRLLDALKIRTISFDDHSQNFTAIEIFGDFIRTEFKEIETYSFVKFEFVNRSLFYTIQGTNATLKPYLLAAHFDVVGAGDNWDYDPFGAEIKDSFIYARGILDDKASMISQLEAVKYFLKKHGQPQRTLYLAYGHDEEKLGLEGAGTIAKKLSHIELEYVLDEGLMIVENIMPNFPKPAALIGIAEKGYLTVKFSVKTTGGHSSVPNLSESAILIMAQAINRLKANPQPSMLGLGPEKEFFEAVGAEMGFIYRLLLSNIWFFKPLLQLVPSMNAVQRTTTAFTIFKSGMKDNVDPPYAEFIINHRIHSNQSCFEVLKYDLKVINDDRINYEIITCNEPSVVSSKNTKAFELIEHTTKQIHPDVIALPTVMLGATDSRFYHESTRNIYKYLPVRVPIEDTKGYHGKNERLSIKNYEDLINFYYNLIKNTDNMHLQNDNVVHSEL